MNKFPYAFLFVKLYTKIVIIQTKLKTLRTSSLKQKFTVIVCCIEPNNNNNNVVKNNNVLRMYDQNWIGLQHIN